MRARRRPRALSRRKTDGYTLVEVMMALAVLATGAVGILGIHQAVMRGNYEARQVATATNIASTWIERLQRDAVGWSRGGPSITFSPATDLLQTRWLRSVPARDAAPTWFVPAAAGDQRATFDHFGRDTAATDEMRYCTNVRLQWVYFGQAMRADVRVWWTRRTPSAQVGGLAGCNGGNLETLHTRRRDVGFVNASTVIRWVAPPAAGGGT